MPARLYANGSPLRIKLRTLTQLKLLSNFYIATFATFEPSCISRESDGVQKFPDLFVVGPFKAHQLKLLDRHSPSACGLPPTATRPPLAIASDTCSSTFSTAAMLISGPVVTPVSNPSPTLNALTASDSLATNGS